MQRLLRLLVLLLYAAAVSAAPEATAPLQCFGAAGKGCTTSAAAGEPVYCRPVLGSGEVECMVHAGSLEHDVCCFQHANGRGCSGGAEDPRYCGYEWDKSRQRTSQGLYWTRRLRPQDVNRSGIVDFDQYCAPSGSVIAAGDDRYCCSRAAVALAERDPLGANKLRCR